MADDPMTCNFCGHVGITTVSNQVTALTYPTIKKQNKKKKDKTNFNNEVKLIGCLFG